MEAWWAVAPGIDTWRWADMPAIKSSNGSRGEGLCPDADT